MIIKPKKAEENHSFLNKKQKRLRKINVFSRFLMAKSFRKLAKWLFGGLVVGFKA